MFKRLITTVFTTLALTTSSFATDIQTIADATFQLWSGGSQMCTTQVIESGDKGTKLLTAFHCIDPDEKNYTLYKVDIDDKGKVVRTTSYNADVLKKNKARDVAILELRDKEVRFPTIEIATDDETNKALKIGLEVLAVGYPGSTYDTQLTLTDGLYSGRANSLVEGLDFPFYRTSSTISPGISGGGLYVKFGTNEDDWKLIGVASQRDPSLPGTANLFGPIEGINDILKGITETTKEILANK